MLDSAQRVAQTDFARKNSSALTGYPRKAGDHATMLALATVQSKDEPHHAALRLQDEA